MHPAADPAPTRFLTALRRLRVVRRALAALVAAACLGLPGLQAWDVDRMTSMAQSMGPRAVAAVGPLQRMLQSLKGVADEQQLAEVNQFFNRRVVFRDDIEVWGVLDYWASPLEMLEKGMGDCEDYAIAKYLSLLAGGMPMQRLRLVYVRAELNGGVQPHMVLAYYASPGADPLVLDNLIPEIRPASRRPDLAPVFSFNSEGLWQGTVGPSAGDPTARLSRWREVLGKARREGFL